MLHPHVKKDISSV